MKSILRLVAAAGLCLALLYAATPLSAQLPAPLAGASADALSQVEEISRDLEEISGLKFHHPVRRGRLDKQGLRRYLEDEIKRSVKPEHLRAEELLLKKFGFVPQDYDLKSATLNLLTEQAVAFYDFRRRKLYLVDSAQAELLEMALVHELAHALADQNFNLRQYIETAGPSDDTALARTAVMEGQAMWLMAEYLARRMSLSVAKVPTLLETIRKQAEEAPDLFPVYKDSPLYMRETLMFPYTSGMMFQHHLFMELGPEAFARPFLQPPVSTRQISHPELYLEGVAPLPATLPLLAGAKTFKKLAAGTLGQLDHSVLLRQFISPEEAADLAPLWRGARYSLLEHKKKRFTVLLYASRWDTPEAAARFFTNYRTILGRKWNRLEVSEESDNILAGKGDDGYFRLERRGDQVLGIEGMPDPLAPLPHEVTAPAATPRAAPAL